MEKRFGEETSYILKAEKSLNSVRAWTERIFNEEGTEDFVIPREIWGWFEEVIVEAYGQAETDLVRRMILLKVIHTREVVRAGFDITEAEKSYDWDMNMVGTVCILHDIARFQQALFGSYSDIQTGFNHAEMGAEMIVKKGLMVAGMDMDRVVEAVRAHSGYEYLGDDHYARLTRDADKLALLRAMPEILEAQIGGFAETGVTEEAVASYKRGEMVRNIDTKTKADLFVAWLAWEFDMNFAETRRLFEDEGIKEWMLGELKERFRVVL